MTRIGPLHADALAAIHGAAFPPGERWDAKAMADILAMPGSFGFLDERGGLVLARLAGGEAEILTLAVHPEARRQHLGRDLVAFLLAETADAPVFLEVAADNLPAQALYETAGFVPCGRRRDYYGVARDAVVLRR